MATNPLVSQGTLNRLRANVIWVTNPQLNVTAPYLGREGIHLALEGEATEYINTMTGAVTSPNPYLKISMTLHLLKPQTLANLYKLQMEFQSIIGDGIVRPDVTFPGLTPLPLINCSIQSVRELSFAGDDAGFAVVIGGYDEINTFLWDF
jgi:hypothetical protein